MKLLSIPRSVPRVLIAVATLALSSTGYSSLIFEYRFNETGSSAPSTGGSSEAFALYSGSGTPGDLHSSSGTGLTGAPGDRAFATSATRMGGSGSDPANGGQGVIVESTAFDGLASFTIQGWFNASEAGGPGRLLERFKSGDQSQYISLTLSSRAVQEDGLLSLQIGSTAAVTSTRDGLLGKTDEWTFFAVTYNYDITSSQGSVSFYVGSENSPVQLLVTRALNGGVIATNDGNAALYLGNTKSFDRPFAGLMDDIRLYGATDGSGALTLSELESLRQADMIPEPSSIVLGVAGVCGLVLFGRRRIL